LVQLGGRLAVGVGGGRRTAVSAGLQKVSKA
jgi:hypothetical protein